MGGRKTIIAGNWKMNNLMAEVKSFFEEISGSFNDLSDREVVVAPALPYIAPANSYSEGKNIKIAVQDFYPVEKGAFTGEVGVEMLRDLSVETVIIGHSERRHVMGEDFDLIRKKVTFAEENGLRVIFCVGETLEQREKNELFAVIEKQLATAFDDNLTVDSEKIVIAYEPVWAIGTGKVATPEQAQEMHAFIRKYMEENYKKGDVSILYGGSVKPDNVKVLMSQPDIDGVLVGGASLKADSFKKLVFFDR